MSSTWTGLASAPTLAAALLGPASTRYRHSAGVAARARGLVPGIDPADAELLIAAAWLHDIGYSPAIADTCFHPLDGARYLQLLGAPQRLCILVANHTGALVEARHRGLLEELREEFPAEPGQILDALTCADLTTTPTGELTTVQERLAEILDRYPPEHVVHKSIRQAAPDLLATVGRVGSEFADCLTFRDTQSGPREWSRHRARGKDQR